MEQLHLPETRVTEEKEKHRSRPPHVARAVERVRKAREELENATRIVRELGLRGLVSPVRKYKERPVVDKKEAARKTRAAKRVAKQKTSAIQLALALRAVAVARAAREAEEAERYATRMALTEEILDEHYQKERLKGAHAHALRNLAGVSHN